MLCNIASSSSCAGSASLRLVATALALCFASPCPLKTVAGIEAEAVTFARRSGQRRAAAAPASAHNNTTPAAAGCRGNSAAAANAITPHKINEMIKRIKAVTGDR